jgi:hypothetical protein
MRVDYVVDAGQRKWFVDPAPDDPISHWARRGFRTKRLAAYLLSELGMFPDEIEAVLSIAQRHPIRMIEIEGELE